MNNQKGFANVVVVAIIAILVVLVGYFAFAKKSEPAVQQAPTPTSTTPANQDSQVDTTADSQSTSFATKRLVRNSYSFDAPTNWIDNGQRDFEGCSWDGVSNDSGDGRRISGEVGIYQKSCFDLATALGKKEYTEKNGYYIIAYYDRGSGTTADEEIETKLAYQKVVETFSIR